VPSRPRHGPGPHVELADIGKSFGGVRALDGISLTIEKGSIHALVGENGAGKSTLGKIVAGVIAPDRGQLLIDGAPVAFRSPREAIVRGIVLIAQELSVAPALSVAENVFLGTEPRRAGFVARRALRRRYDELAAAAGFELSGDLPGRGLRTADQQKVEILRALCRDARLIVMDEPTAALPRPDADRLYQVIRRLAAGGTTIVLVSHFLREVAELADEVTILRDGHLVRTALAADETEETMLSSMLGRSLGATFPARRPVPADAPVVLEARGLSASGVHDVSLDVRAGEIVGLAGLVGSGRTELARALCQAQRVTAGTVTTSGTRLAGRPPGGRRMPTSLWPARGPNAALRAGLAMIPESRKEQGLMLGRPIAENVSLASLPRLAALGLVRRRAERQAVTGVLGQVGVRVPAQAAPVSTLSGGNQQKALFARILLRGPRVLVADEPTRGVDVGAKRAIYELLTSLAADGLGVLLISSDAEEVLGLAHRVLVMRAGRIAAELRGAAMTEGAILAAAFGAPDASPERGV
jgi:rhamnose transport system ATP-binding protein